MRHLRISAVLISDYFVIFCLFSLRCIYLLKVTAPATPNPCGRCRGCIISQIILLCRGVLKFLFHYLPLISVIDATITNLVPAKPNKSCCLIKREMRHVMPEGIFQLVSPFQGKMSPCFTTTPRKEKNTECPRLISLLVYHSTVSLNLEIKILLMVFHACTAFFLCSIPAWLHATQDSS